MNNIITIYAQKLIKENNPTEIRKVIRRFREATYIEFSQKTYDKINKLLQGENSSMDELNRELENIYHNINFLESVYGPRKEVIDLWEKMNSIIVESYMLEDEGEIVEELSEMEKELMKKTI